MELALPAYMLIGYATEVVVKGLIAARAGTDGSITWMPGIHLEPGLFDRASVALTEAELFLVQHQLYHAVKWSGRYPTPLAKDADKFEKQIEAARGFIFSDPRAISPDHYRRARE